MALSGILASVPKHQTILPISGKKIEYRPFIVKEEKILLMAAETKNEKTINSAVREVVLACTNNAVDVFKIPTTDMEYLFIQLRSHSVGETTKPNIKCTKCELPNECTVDLSKINIQTNPIHSKIIKLTEDINILMRYPTLNDVKEMGDENEVEKTIELLVHCIDKIYHGETIYNTEEMDFSEVRNFIDEMTQEQFKKIFNFIETMPRLEEKVSFKCVGCGEENNITLKGITSFF